VGVVLDRTSLADAGQVLHGQRYIEVQGELFPGPFVDDFERAARTGGA
jgi:hypothetical protein